MSDKLSFWRRTPPALFPCLLGFLGLGLTWRFAAKIWGVPMWIGETISVIALSLFIITFSSYLCKIIARPSVVLDDMKVVPARGAVSAGSMCLMVISAYLIPINIELARVIWWISLVLHCFYMGCVIWAFIQAKEISKNITPPIFLPFIGFIVAAVPGPMLGYMHISMLILVVTMPAFLFIVLMSLVNLAKGYVPAPLHSSYAIILAPTSVYGAGAYGVWSTDVYFWFWSAALAMALAMVPFVRFLTKGGWNPGWGGFTFPLSAFSTMMLMGVEAGFGGISQAASIFGLTLATFLIPYIVWKTYHFWMIGKLANATGAAVV